MNYNLKISLATVLLIPLTVGMLSCGSFQKENKEVLATVGNKNITRQEFVLAYEFAPKSKTQPGKKIAFNSVLENMIDQLLLAEEGYRRGLDTDPVINRITDFYKRAAIVRELFLKHVRNSVDVSEREKRLAYKKMKTSLYTKHYVFKNKDNIEQFIKNPEDISHSPIHTGLETVQLDKYGYVDRVHWNSIDRRIEDILFQLEVNELSTPYFDGALYHIFKVVEKEYDSILTENDFYSRSPSIEKVIRRRQEHAVAFNYVQSIMNSQNLIIRSNTLKKLTGLFWESFKNSGKITHVPTTREIEKLTTGKDDFIRETIATFDSGAWTVGDFLFNYELNPVEISYKHKQSVRSGLKQTIATLVRDYVLSERGIKEGLDSTPSVLQEEQNWKNKLLAYRVQRELSPDLLADLRKETDIVVDTTVLYATETSDRGLPRKIDFVKTFLE